MYTMSMPTDRTRDFCQWEYSRPKLVHSSALRQETFLFHILRSEGISSRVFDILKKIQKIVGEFNTVWGIKKGDQGISLELYFYDYSRSELSLDPNRLLNETTGHPLIGKIPPRDCYFMWSVELNLATASFSDKIDIYSSAAGGTISAGVCYSVCNEGIQLKNLYSFFENPRDQQAIYDHLSSCPRLSSSVATCSFIKPGFMDEQVYVHSTKRHGDAIYYSRVTVRAAIQALATFSIGEPFHQTFKAFESMLDHHFFDVGLDLTYCYSSDSIVSRIGIYGIL